jgi:hypothetical protein
MARKTVFDRIKAKVFVAGDLPAFALQTFSWFVAGNQAAGAKKASFVMPYAGTIVDVRVRADTAPVGSTALYDINKNGTTMFTTQGNRPTIADGGNNSTTTLPDVTTVAVNDRLTFDNDQIGSGTPGADVMYSVTVKRALIA